MLKDKEINEPEWAHRSNHIEYKPDWIDKIPHELWDLGKLFFPIPRKKKSWRYHFHDEENRFTAKSETLNAYLEAGWNYGIVCDNDLIVVDVDDLRYLETITEDLPDTVQQITGSRSGKHLFFICNGLNTRQTLFHDLENHALFEGLNVSKEHIGEIKCDPHGYVLGPESIHPSGNKYGPLEGDEISTVNKEEILDNIQPFISTDDKEKDIERWGKSKDSPRKTSNHELYTLTADDVAPWLSPNDNTSHPVHGSRHGMNFMKNNDGETFVCWRCQIGSNIGCVISGVQLLAMQGADNYGDYTYGSYFCETVRRNWLKDSKFHYYAWMQAVSNNLISPEPIPYRVIKGYAVEYNLIDENDNVGRNLYHRLYDTLLWLGYIKL